MEKKVAVEVNGRIVRVMKHTMDDVILLGGSTVNKTVKNPPKELTLTAKPIIAKKENLPEMVTTKSEIDIVKDKLDNKGIKYHPNTGLDKLKAKLDEGSKE